MIGISADKEQDKINENHNGQISNQHETVNEI